MPLTKTKCKTLSRKSLFEETLCWFGCRLFPRRLSGGEWVGRRGGRRTEVGGSGGLGAVVCGWWREGTQYHPPRPFNPPVLGGAVEPVSTPLPPTITQQPTTHQQLATIDPFVRICVDSYTHIHLYKKTYPPFLRVSLHVCFYMCSRRSRALQGRIGRETREDRRDLGGKGREGERRFEKIF